MTLRGPAEFADAAAYVRSDPVTGEALAAIPKINGKSVKNVQQLMREYTDVLPVWIM